MPHFSKIPGTATVSGIFPVLVAICIGFSRRADAEIFKNFIPS
jgi:hypothetical protein